MRVRDLPGYQFPDPRPPALRQVGQSAGGHLSHQLVVADLAKLRIDWRMLHSVRPDTK